MIKYASIITCLMDTNREVKTVADVFGAWAVHRSIVVGDPGWTITQVATGQAIPRSHTEFLTKKKAILAARRIEMEVGARKVTRAVGKRIVAIINQVLTEESI